MSATHFWVLMPERTAPAERLRPAHVNDDGAAFWAPEWPGRWLPLTAGEFNALVDEGRVARHYSDEEGWRPFVQPTEWEARR